MNKAFFSRTLFGVIAFGTIALRSALPLEAQEVQPQPAPPPAQQLHEEASPQQLQPQEQPMSPKPVDTAGKLSISLTGEYGVGFGSADVGKTTQGDTVTIRGGGGFGGGVGLGYGLSQSWDLDFDLGGQVSVLTPAVKDATGSFSRSFLLATIKFKRPTSDTGRLIFGFGLGSYNNGKLDIDASDAGSDHTVIKYKDALGFHLTGTFERFIGPRTSVQVGGKMYFVTYKAKSWTTNGVSSPAGSLKDELRDFNGNGLDVVVRVSQYF